MSFNLNSQESIDDLRFTHNKKMKLNGVTKTDTDGVYIHSYNVGTETYYKNGKIESIFKVDKKLRRLTEFYDLNGDTLVSNGYGFKYEIETGYGNFEHRDSLVFTIKDGYKTGVFNRYRRYLNSAYYHTESGFYKNGIQDGKWISNEFRLGIFSIKNYLNGELNGYYSLRQNRLNKVETGYYKDGLKDELWVTKDTNDNYIEMAPYFKGYKNGLLIKYFPSGHKSETGMYNQIKGLRESYSIDLVTGVEIKNIYQVDNLEVKNNVWEYYNEQGKIIKIEKYNNGILIK